MSNPTLVDRVIPEADIVPLSFRVGAEIRNVRLSGDLPEATIDAINQALLKHKVIFFRDQDHLDDAEQELFARRLGDLVPHPTQGAISGTASILESRFEPRRRPRRPVAYRRDLRRRLSEILGAARRRHPAGRRRHHLVEHACRL